MGRRTRLSAVLLALFAVGGCAPFLKAKELKGINIAFQEWVGYGLFYLAQEKEFCKEEGIELVFIDEQSDSARRDAFNRGMLDCEAGTIDLLVSKVAQGTPIVAVMEIDRSFGSDAIVATENITTLEDLKGKRVALARDDVGETLLAVLFQEEGLSLNDVILVPELAEEAAASFLNGKADACVTWEPQVTKALQRPGAHILTSTKEHPGIIIDTLNVRRDLVENSPALVKKIMRAWFKGLDFYRGHPVEASEIIAKHYAITPEQYRKQVQGLQWEDHGQQRSPAAAQEWAEVFNAIAGIKLANARISQRPDAAKSLNHTLLERLYEDSQ